MAPEAGDPFAVALWRAHLERALRAARSLKAGKPSPQVAARDPYALRALVLILVVAAFFAAGGDRVKRIAAAFDWHGVVSAANYRIDAWVTPPAYTGRPPLILPGLRPGEQAQARGSGPVTVPAGSTLVVRATGQSASTSPSRAASRRPRPKPGRRRPRAPRSAASPSPPRAPPPSSGGGDDVIWAFNAIPDRAPTIALAKEPEAQLRGSLLLNYKVEDDYGVVDAQATFERKVADGRAGAQGKPPRPLFDAPNFTLVLPQARTRNGAGQTTKDLSEHPWAGVDVAMTLVARDEANNEGRSTPHEMRLPERPFAKPLPRALVEQRRNLALDANAKDHVLMALDALTIAPERFIPETNIYLGPALDLLAAFPRRERRRPARRGGAAVGDGGVS